MTTPTTAVPAFGASLTYLSGSSYVPVANCTNIQPSGPKRKFSDTTQFAGGGWTEKTPTVNDGGSVTGDIDYNSADAGHIALKNAQLNATLLTFRVVFPDATYEQFNAYVEEIVPDFKVTDVVKGKLTLQVTGAVSFGP